jgi:hypothetical protein
MISSFPSPTLAVDDPSYGMLSSLDLSNGEPDFEWLQMCGEHLDFAPVVGDGQEPAPFEPLLTEDDIEAIMASLGPIHVPASPPRSMSPSSFDSWLTSLDAPVKVDQQPQIPAQPINNLLSNPVAQWCDGASTKKTTEKQCNNKLAQDARWPESLLRLSTKDLNALLRNPGHGIDDVKELKAARRRYLSRTYSGRHRDKRRAAKMMTASSSTHASSPLSVCLDDLMAEDMMFFS